MVLTDGQQGHPIRIGFVPLKVRNPKINHNYNFKNLVNKSEVIYVEEIFTSHTVEVSDSITL